MSTETDERTLARRKLILRDSLAFVSLLLATAALFAVTLFLFRSFTTHRDDLARRWSARGIQAIQAGKPADAVTALRTALTYAPGTRQYELLLAQALGDAGHTEESYNYFMGLWAAEPGSGPINLQLARLAAHRNDRQKAIDSYRAAIYGTWEGDGVARRAQVRLELARYLIAANELPQARMELLIAGGNVSGDPAFDLTLGSLLEQAADPADAAAYARKALNAHPDDPAALEAVGRLAFQSGDFETAHRMLLRAETRHADTQSPAPWTPEDVSMLKNSARILELLPTRTLPARDRVLRILAVRDLAKKRFTSCSAQLSETPATASPHSVAEPATPLQPLAARWSGEAATSPAETLLRDPERQDAVMQLVFDTESQTAALCGQPSGDDAILLLAASHQPVPAGGSR